MNEDQLPDQWEVKKLNEVAEYQSGNITPADHPETEFNYISLKHIESGTGEFGEVEVTLGEEIKSAKRQFTDQDILYGRLRPYLNKVVAPNFDGICSTDIFALRPKEGVNRDYLHYYLLSERVRGKAEHLMSGANLPRVSKGDLMEFKVPLPPHSEQRVIVEKLDELLGRINETAELHSRAEKISDELSHSIFLSLVEEVDYREVQTGDVIESSQYGISQAMNEECEGYPILRMGNYDEKGEMDYSELKHVTLSDDEFEKYRLEKGDILFNRTNSKELVGKTAIFDGKLDEAVFASYLIRVFIDEDEILPEYFVRYLNSPYGRAEIDKKSKQAVSQANINSTELRNMRIPLPSLEEQKRIVEQVEGSEDRIEIIESSLTHRNSIVEELRKSLLATAFKGELSREDDYEIEVVANSGGQSSLQQFKD